MSFKITITQITIKVDNTTALYASVLQEDNESEQEDRKTEYDKYYSESRKVE